MHLLGIIVISMFSHSFISAAGSFITAPLPVRNLYAPMMRFLDPMPDSALRDYSNWDIKLDQHLANIHQINHGTIDFLMVDMEMYVADLTVRKSLSNDMDVSIQLPVQRPFNGVLDPFINDFHKLLNIPAANRSTRPNNTFAYHLKQGGSAGWQGKNRWELGNATISLRKQIIDGDGWAIAALAAVKLPTASKQRGWGSGKPDAGLGAVASFNSEHWFMHAEGWLIHPFINDVPGTQFNASITGPAYILGWDYQPYYTRVSSTLGWKYSQQLSAIAQVQVGTSPYSTPMQQLDSKPMLISFGIQAETDNSLGWTLVFTENGLTQLTTQDFSFTFSLHYSFSD
ncbi:DUF3187 family protein [Mariprofundus sp. EBB-1]|uniref:DUF3187 family protein n=1 Tax=Mariprofundus sp. EBB-1 TaxID=2650971 RepID=UPI0021043088|nr:DUF3187 family protein [Mariprofundus sp. EBB-1]